MRNYTDLPAGVPCTGGTAVGQERDRIVGITELLGEILSKRLLGVCRLSRQVTVMGPHGRLLGIRHSNNVSGKLRHCLVTCELRAVSAKISQLTTYRARRDACSCGISRGICTRTRVGKSIEQRRYERALFSGEAMKCLPTFRRNSCEKICLMIGDLKRNLMPQQELHWWSHVLSIDSESMNLGTIWHRSVVIAEFSEKAQKLVDIRSPELER